MSAAIRRRSRLALVVAAAGLCLSCASTPTSTSATASSEACFISDLMTLYDASEVAIGTTAAFAGRHPAAFSPWVIAQGDEPEGLALIDSGALLAQGETDKQGRILVEPEAMKRIRSASCIGGAPIWLVFPGRTVRLNGKP